MLLAASVAKFQSKRSLDNSSGYSALKSARNLGSMHASTIFVIQVGFCYISVDYFSIIIIMPQDIFYLSTQYLGALPAKGVWESGQTAYFFCSRYAMKLWWILLQ